MTCIKTTKISEILLEEFMTPHNLSSYELVNTIGMPVSYIEEVLCDKRKITAKASMRLDRYFGLSEKYFLNLQSDIDIRKAKKLFF